MRVSLIIILLPFFINAQSFNPTKLRPSYDFGRASLESRPKQPETLPTMKPLNLSSKDVAKAKLAREEQKLIKIARKTWGIEANLKKEQEKLVQLEKSLKTNDNYKLLKEIETYKKQIAKSNDKLSKAKIILELRTEKVKNIELAIEELKFKR